jgi:sec-independent protein translocase protein TatA
MGVGGIGIWQLLIILVIVLVLFGAKRLRNVGGDLGAAIKGFKTAMKEGESGEEKTKEPEQIESREKTEDTKKASQSQEKDKS